MSQTIIGIIIVICILFFFFSAFGFGYLFFEDVVEYGDNIYVRFYKWITIDVFENKHLNMIGKIILEIIIWTIFLPHIILFNIIYLFCFVVACFLFVFFIKKEK